MPATHVPADTRMSDIRMDEREFVASRRVSWARLASILDRATAPTGLRGLSHDDLQDLGRLYRRAASDLAYTRAHAGSQTLIAHLNQLVARGFSVLYQRDAHDRVGIVRFLRDEFPAAFRRRLPYFLAAVSFLLVGALAGYLLVIHSRSNIDLFVPPESPFRKSLEVWESGRTARRISDADAAMGASLLMQNNIRVSFMAYATGILGGVLTALLMFYNGAMLGAFAGAMTWAHQHANFWPGIVPHGVVEITTTCIAGGAGLSLGWALLAPGAYRRRDALVRAARDSVKLVLGGIFLLIFAGLVEAFISHSLLPRPLKIVFGVASALALSAYLGLSGRNQQSHPQMDSDERT